MKNVTISMDDALLRAVRIEAAQEGKSVSRFLADMISGRVGQVILSPST